jgi:hypothetical protein
MDMVVFSLKPTFIRRPQWQNQPRCGAGINFNLKIAAIGSSALARAFKKGRTQTVSS